MGGRVLKWPAQPLSDTGQTRLSLPILVCGEPLTILRFVTSPSNYMVGSPRGGIASYTSREIPQSIQHNSENRDV